MKKAEIISLLFVRMTGLEPAHLAALEPKSNVSANSTTSAFLVNLRKNLNLARLPIPPRAQITFYFSTNSVFCEYRLVVRSAIANNSSGFGCGGNSPFAMLANRRAVIQCKKQKNAGYVTRHRVSHRGLEPRTT